MHKFTQRSHAYGDTPLHFLCASLQFVHMGYAAGHEEPELQLAWTEGFAEELRDVNETLQTLLHVAGQYCVMMYPSHLVLLAVVM